MKTLEDIDNELKNSPILRIQMKTTIGQLKHAEKKIGTDPLKILILGHRKLTKEEFEVAAKKFGVNGLFAISAMEKLSIAQKQYIFREMGWDMKEVLA